MDRTADTSPLISSQVPPTLHKTVAAVTSRPTSISLDRRHGAYSISSLYRDLRDELKNERAAYGDDVLGLLKPNIGVGPNHSVLLVWLEAEHIQPRIEKLARERGYEVTIRGNDWWYKDSPRHLHDGCSDNVWEGLSIR